MKRIIAIVLVSLLMGCSVFRPPTYVIQSSFTWKNQGGKITPGLLLSQAVPLPEEFEAGAYGVIILEHRGPARLAFTRDEYNRDPKIADVPLEPGDEIWMQDKSCHTGQLKYWQNKPIEVTP